LARSKCGAGEDWRFPLTLNRRPTPTSQPAASAKATGTASISAVLRQRRSLPAGLWGRQALLRGRFGVDGSLGIHFGVSVEGGGTSIACRFSVIFKSAACRTALVIGKTGQRLVIERLGDGIGGRGGLTRPFGRHNDPRTAVVGMGLAPHPALLPSMRSIRRDTLIGSTPSRAARAVWVEGPSRKDMCPSRRHWAADNPQACAALFKAGPKLTADVLEKAIRVGRCDRS
jgi:hypothetical protein